ncbi:TonB-dependent receptor [Thermospira aquatica]|uniref:TonB-dependent receptor n=1 Tax=Thermospira aquatica TaxID=2828656 RepID=A0AAX3BCU2_9SPIR|nr:hypothetical protein [Thermospira aquatica]URA09986.1 hypothetical protein KDW03_10970 [Thermospira aquatica]
MKKFFWILACFCWIGVFVWGQENISSTIVLPDVKIVLEGDSSIPLQDQTNLELSGQEIDFGRVDLSELSRLRKSEYYKVELTNERKTPSFSLSSFRLFYGTSENLFSDITVGKRVDKLNYLVSYLRNSRGSLALSNSRLYNTEFKLDDINVDLIFTPSSQWEVQTEVGYYTRELGLYTNRGALSEQVRYFPAKIGVAFIADTYSLFQIGVEGNYLERQHKLLANEYTNQLFYHFSPSFSYEVSWAKDNFLKIDGAYFYVFQDTLFHEGNFGFLDRLNILSSLSLDVGTRLYFSSRDPFFWYPLVMMRYRYTQMLVFTLGLEGERQRFLGERLLEENQYFFVSTVRRDRWSPQIGIQYLPAENFSIKGNAFYHLYQVYANPVYLPERDMFTYEEKTNVSLLAIQGSLDWTLFKGLLWKNTLTYTLAFSQDIYEIESVLFSSFLEWKLQEIGLTATLRSRYYPHVQLANGATLPDAVILDLELSQKLGRDFYLEFAVDNILNQNHFQRPSLPEGGIQVLAGLRILL